MRSWSGAALAFVVGEIDEGIALIDRALRLNPNLMDAWLSSGLARLVTGEWETVIDHMARAMRLSPFDPILFLMQQGTATAYFFTGRYDEAAAWAAKSIAEYPSRRASAKGNSAPVAARSDAARVEPQRQSNNVSAERASQVGRGPAKSRSARVTNVLYDQGDSVFGTSRPTRMSALTAAIGA
jgi:tetratricopeptide (TPR) repeat protein